MRTSAEFSRLAARVDNAGRWGGRDELGTLNFLTGPRRPSARWRSSDLREYLILG